MQVFEKTIQVRWADVDQNRHVRHSVYYDYGAFIRMRLIHAAGYSAAALTDKAVGPILFEEKCSFIREILLEDSIRINVLKENVNADASRWTLHHELFNQHDQKVAHITAVGAWLDLGKRKLTVPPAELGEAFNALPAGEGYVRKKKS
jgi:acyl-CoA thioester hydrolase